MLVEPRPVTSIRPYEGNPRVNDQAVDAVAESIRQFGFRVPLIVDQDGVIVAGHTRLKAALKLGLTEVPVHVAADLLPDQIRALRLADNKCAELSEWNLDLLTIELGALHESSPDLDLATLGFDPEELERLLTAPQAPLDQGEADAIPAEQEVVVSQPGEVYVLGPHRLMCGDSTNKTDWQALMCGNKCSMIVTSPPYAEQREYDPSSGFKPIPPDEYSGWFLTILNNCRKYLDEKGNLLLNIKEGASDGQRLLYVKRLVIDIAESGMIYKDELVWRKTGVPGKWPDRLRNDWEPVFHFANDRACHFFPQSCAHESDNALKYVAGSNGKTYGGNIGASKAGTHSGTALPGNVFDFSTKLCPSGIDHPAAYPVQVPEFLIKIFSPSGSTIIEPFGGSGSTIIAAAKTGRICRAMEISPRYCDVIRRRWTSWATANGQDPGPGALN